MITLSKKELKRTVKEVIAPFEKAVNKRFEVIDKRFEAVDKRFDAIDKRLDKLESQMIMIDMRLASVEADVKWMKENSSAIFTRIDRFIALYEHHDQEFKILDAQVRERFENLEQRVAQLEAVR